MASKLNYGKRFGSTYVGGRGNSIALAIHTYRECWALRPKHFIKRTKHASIKCRQASYLRMKAQNNVSAEPSLPKLKFMEDRDA